MEGVNFAIWYHLVTVIPLLLFKLAVLIVGYLFAKLGHNLLIKGISGEFKFHAGFKGSKADVVSASPGLFFILMATILISVAIIKDKPYSTKVTTEILSTGTFENKENTHSKNNPENEKATLPENPD